MKPIEQVLVEELAIRWAMIKPETIVGIYPYGSLVYGTSSENSDYDFVVIVDMSEDYLQYESENVDIHFMSIDHYKSLLKQHDIMALECFYNPSPIMKYETEFELHLPTLRKKISAICSNSWAKAGKKMNLPDESDYIGLKSLFHSFRILSYGIQLAKDGEIRFSNCGIMGTCQNFFRELTYQFEHGDRWDEFKDRYKLDHNAMATQFRALAPIAS